MKAPTVTYIQSFDSRRLLAMDEPMSEDLRRFGTRVVLDADKEFVEEYRPRDLDTIAPKVDEETISVGKILDIKHQVGNKQKFRMMG